MLRPHLGVLTAATLALAACSQPPIAVKDGAPQQSAATVRDWDSVAHRITAELTQRGMLLTPQTGVTPSAPPWGPYYVHVVTPGSSFLQAVADSLKVDIANHGGTVARVPDGAVVINLQVDYVKHGPRDVPPSGLGTVAGAVAAAGIMAAAAEPHAALARAGVEAGAALATGVIADAALATYPSMSGEVMWQASIVTPQQVLMQVGAPLYVPAGDLPLYAGDVKLTELTTPGAPTVLEARRMRYDP